MDLTFSAPKSVSIESLVNANIDVMKAHELAVKKTLEKIEEFAETRKKKNKGCNSDRAHREIGYWHV
ncbi:hypothetical protein DKE50_021745 (plasmid) [Acinetobacter nosocomialis]|nr:hypothetical protein DKE50_021745 [Acinetobacter nosocomialis]